jgi:hypothetical protein
VLRAVRNEVVAEEDYRLVWSPRFPLGIFHFPIRSLAQYRLRVDVALANPAFASPKMLGRLSEAREHDDLEGFYTSLLPDEAELESELAAGEIVRDERVRRFMAALQDEFGGGARPDVDSERTAEQIQAERDAMEMDGMHVLARTERMLMIRNDHRNRLRRAMRTEPKRRPLRRRLRMFIGRLLGRGSTQREAATEAEAANGELEAGEADRVA